MKLFYFSGACSLSPHIAARELGLSLELEKVDLSTKKTESGRDFLSINPKGYVPALEIAPGQVVTEGVAILLYLASQKPESPLSPQPGSQEYIRLVEWLVYIATELHKGVGALFAGPNPAVLERASARLKWVSEQLKGKDFLLGDFSLADGYLFTVLGWSDYLKLDLTPFDGLNAYRARVAARAKVQEALQAEGLLTPA